MTKRSLLSVLLVSLVASSWPITAQVPALSPNHAVISEVQAGTSADLNDEFIELYNPLDESIDLTGWRLEKASGGLTPTTAWDKLALDGITMEPQTSVLVCRSGGTTADCSASFSFSLAYTGGHIRLVSPDESTDLDETDTPQIDLLGWGNAAQPEGWTAPDDPALSAAPALAAGKSLERKISAEGLLQDSDHNRDDFMLSTVPTPGELPPLPLPIDEEPEPTLEPETNPEPEPVNYAKLIINEVLPDPAPPKTDADDEFVELYNPSSATVNLEGYILQTGSSLQYRYTMPDISIAAKGYKVLYSKTTNATLSNSGSRVQLLAPDNTISAELVSYGDSPEGKSWSRFGSKFSWTDRTTPGGLNKSHSPVVKKTTSSAKSTRTTLKKSYARITLSEVFPDPDSPQKDADDEFVELYNPNSFAVNLEGYKIKTGSSLRTSETLDNITIRPKSYIAVFNRDANLSLTNSGGAALLLDPNGKELSRTDTYPKALPRQSWALINGKWQWTGKPTPAAGNIAQAISSQTLTSRSQDPTATSPLSGVLGNLSQPAAIPTDTPPNWRLIAGVGAAVTTYLAYESRHDIRNWIYRWQRHHKIGHGGK